MKQHAFAAALAVAFLACHLPYLPASLEDLDSINFALALGDFDIARHRPHPPGYPVFVALGKALHLLVPSEAHALSVLAMVAGSLAAFALVRFFAALGAGETSRVFPSIGATLATMTAPLYWFTAARPLSDMPGFAAATGVMALTMSARTGRGLMVAAGLAGLAAGIRSQVAWLTVPLLVLVLVRFKSPPTIVRALVAFAIGCLVWLGPIVVVTGGPGAYWRALSSQGADDFGGVTMLWTTPTPDQIVRAMDSAFVAPWAVPAVAAIVLGFAAFGALRLFRSARPALVTLAVAFGPYLVFDLLFQEAATTRYALPLVVPVAFLAVRGVGVVGAVPSALAVAVLAMFDAHVGGTSIAAYARRPAPAFRLLADLRVAAQSAEARPVLAMDRREDLDLRRPILWVGKAMPPVAGRLPAPPQHEWLELAKYWNSGGRSPVWFVADPLRTSIDLVEHGKPSDYMWDLPYPALLGGVRPNQMRWYRLDRPEWYVGRGWALTPESAGVSQLDGRGLSADGSIDAWVHKRVLDGGRLIIGGRNLEPAGSPRLTIAIGSTAVRELALPPGAFVDVGGLPPLDPSIGATDYSTLTVRVTPPSRVAIEQFDVSGSRPIFGFGSGWHEPEYQPATGRQWRWLSGSGALRLPAGPERALVLHLEGESPRKYFSRSSRLVVRGRDRVVFDRMLSGDFSLDIPLPPGSLPDHTVTLETDQTYVPAERTSRTQDRRHLGLRIFKCELKLAPGPAS